MEFVEQLWKNPQDDYEVVNHPHILEKITIKNLKTLKKEEWLNDAVLNGYSRLVNLYLTERNINKYVANSYFITLFSKEFNSRKLERILKRQNVPKFQF